MPSPRTALNKLLFWCSQKLGWHEFEISDSTRSVVKITVTMDRENAPALALWRRLRMKLNRDPNAIGHPSGDYRRHFVCRTYLKLHNGAKLITKSQRAFILYGTPDGGEPFSTIMIHSNYLQSTEINSTRSRKQLETFLHSWSYIKHVPINFLNIFEQLVFPIFPWWLCFLPEKQFEPTINVIVKISAPFREAPTRNFPLSFWTAPPPLVLSY